MVHTPSHGYNDPNLPGAATILEHAIYGDPASVHPFNPKVRMRGFRDPMKALQEQFTDLTGAEAAEYIAAYKRSREQEIAGRGTRGYTIPAQRSVSGNPNVFAKLPTYTPPYTGVLGSNRETETDLIWTEEGGFQRLALREREGPAADYAQKKYEESPAGRKEAVKGAGGATVHRKGKFSVKRRRGISRRGLYV